MPENDQEEPFIMDFDAVEQQLKITTPEQLEELSKRVNAHVQKLRAKTLRI